MNRILRYVNQKFQQWGNDLEGIPGLGKLVAKSKVASLPGFQKVPLYDVMRFFMQSMSKGVVFQRAAAITYRIFVAIIPMAIALFSAIAFLGEGFRNTFISLLQSVVPPYAWPAVEGVIFDVVMRQNGTLWSSMFIVGIYFTIVCIMGIVSAMTTSYYNEGQRTFLQQIGLSIKLMLLTFFIIVLVAALFIFASLAIHYIHTNYVDNPQLYSFAVSFFKWVLVFAAVYFLISTFYYMAPPQRGNYRFFSAGSSTCAILLVVLLGVINLYFSNFSNYNLIYGSLGALFAILLWINWSSTIFLICYDLNVSIAKAKSENKELGDHLDKEETDYSER